MEVVNEPIRPIWVELPVRNSAWTTLKMSRRESSTLEIKENFNISHDSKALYRKTMAGFANNEGGYMLFGVKNQPHDLVGMVNDNFAKFDPTQLQQFLSE